MYTMLNIHIKTIPDTEQRYDTSGDYIKQDDGSVLITVSDMQDSRHEFLIALHELVESYLCEQRGVTIEAIDAFDMEYEKNRAPDDQTSEPGNHPDAPYHREHMFAIEMEKKMAEELGVDFDEYTKSWNNLFGNN